MSSQLKCIHGSFALILDRCVAMCQKERWPSTVSHSLFDVGVEVVGSNKVHSIIIITLQESFVVATEEQPREES